MKKIILLITFIISFSLVNVNVKADELSCTKTLQKGSKGKEVLLLQNKLNKVMNCNLEKDSIYGNNTLSCVKKLQKKYNLNITGTVNNITCKKINILTKTTTNTTSKFDCSKIVDKNSGKTIIKQMQNRLNEVMNCSLEVDGIYGKNTSACIRKFQIEYDLDDTGKMNTTTCEKLTSKTVVENKEKTLSVTSNSIIIKDEDNIAKIMLKASDDSKVLKTTFLGEIYTYTNTTKVNGITWYKVKIDNSYGYIKEDYIEKNFIIVDISQQKLILYKNKQVLLNAKVVTGTYNKHDTPTGYNVLRKKNLVDGKYLIGYKPDGTLDYKSWVDYWMPFITRRGIGFHDASWRNSSEYTNTRYLYDGSHGCVNMQKSDAKKLFDNISNDIAVIVRD